MRFVPAAIAIGVGAWCSFASLDVATIDRARVAMFPAWWTLASAIVVAALVAAALKHAAARLGWQAPWRPLILLSALALPYLPWLPDVFPVLRALAGPGRWIVWLVVAAFAIVDAGVTVRARRPALAVFAASALVIGTAAFTLTATALYPGGDEPHYLVITQSLLRDGDLKIENNHLREDYAAYFHARLEPHYLARGVDREIYSVHPIGISMLIAPAFAAAGYRGVVLFLVLLASAVAALVWWRAFELTQSAAAATFGWAATCMTTPFLFNSFAVYPEVAAASCVLVAFPWNLRSGDLTWLSRGLAVAALPWLSSKYVVMAGVLVGVAMLRATSIRRASLVAAPFVTSLAAWLAFFYVIWGSPSPTAAYGGNASTALSTLAAGGPGLWFDQEYGLLPYAPVLAIALTGLAVLPRRLAIEIALVVGALLATVGSFHIWWGGSASPGRPMIAAVPLLAVPIAWQFLAAASSSARRQAQLLLLVVSIGIGLSLLFAQEGLLIANDRSGRGRFLEWLSIAGELPPLFPSFIAGPRWIAFAKTAVWVAAALGTGALLARLKPGTTSTKGGSNRTVVVPGFSRAGASVLARALFAVVVATTITSLPFFRGDAHAATNRTASRMLDTFDSATRPIAVVYDPLRRIPPTNIPLVLSLFTTRDLWTTRFSLPAGTYRVDPRPLDEARPDEALALTIGRQRTPLRSWSLSRTWPDHLEFHLPVSVSYVGFRHTPERARPFETLRVVPLHIVDVGRRGWPRPVLQAASFGDVDAYFHDDDAYPEPSGFWTRGGASTTMTLYPIGDAKEVKLRIHGGPIANQIRLRAATWEEQLDLRPGTPQEVRVPRDGSTIRLEISTIAGFVPAERDTTSSDRRHLGAWIELMK